MKKTVLILLVLVILVNSFVTLPGFDVSGVLAGETPSAVQQQKTFILAEGSGINYFNSTEKNARGAILTRGFTDKYIYPHASVSYISREKSIENRVDTNLIPYTYIQQTGDDEWTEWELFYRVPSEIKPETAVVLGWTVKAWSSKNSTEEYFVTAYSGSKSYKMVAEKIYTGDINNPQVFNDEINDRIDRITVRAKTSARDRGLFMDKERRPFQTHTNLYVKYRYECYKANGHIESAEIDTKCDFPEYGTMEAQADIPKGTSIRYKVFSYDIPGTAFDESKAVEAIPGQPIKAERKRFIKRRAYLESDGEDTPVLKNLTINYRENNDGYVGNFDWRQEAGAVYGSTQKTDNGIVLSKKQQETYLQPFDYKSYISAERVIENKLKDNSIPYVYVEQGGNDDWTEWELFYRDTSGGGQAYPFVTDWSLEVWQTGHDVEEYIVTAYGLGNKVYTLVPNRGITSDESNAHKFSGKIHDYIDRISIRAKTSASDGFFGKNERPYQAHTNVYIKSLKEIQNLEGYVESNELDTKSLEPQYGKFDAEATAGGNSQITYKVFSYDIPGVAYDESKALDVTPGEIVRLNGGRYLKWRAYLKTDGSTLPVLKSVTVNYTREVRQYFDRLYFTTPYLTGKMKDIDMEDYFITAYINVPVANWGWVVKPYINDYIVVPDKKTDEFRIKLITGGNDTSWQYAVIFVVDRKTAFTPPAVNGRSTTPSGATALPQELFNGAIAWKVVLNSELRQEPKSTATPVPTATAAPTPSDEPTVTAAPTPGAAATNTPSPSGTPAATATGTPKPTAATAPTATATPEVTPAPTATATPTPGAAATNTPSPSGTPAATATSTPKPTATAAPSATATHEVTPAPTATATPTPGAAATNTPSPSGTPAVAATSTPKPTATATPSATPTPAVQPTPTPVERPTQHWDTVFEFIRFILERLGYRCEIIDGRITVFMESETD